MIGAIAALVVVVVAGVALATRAGASTPFASQGGSLDGAIPVDSILARTPAMQAQPAVRQTIMIYAVPPAAPSGAALPPVPLQVIVAAMRQYPDGSWRIAAKVPPASIATLVATVPQAKTEIPTALQQSGFYVWFSPDKVWALGAMAAAA